MGCGKSKHSVPTADGALQKGESRDASSKKHREVRFETSPGETVQAIALEEDAVAEALPLHEKTKERQETLVPRVEGTEHEAIGTKEEQEVEKEATLEEKSHNSLDNVSRKDDEALNANVNKPTQEVSVNGEPKAKEEPATAVIAEPTISAVEPEVLTVYADQTNTATSA